MIFADLGLGETLLKAIAEADFETPTPIQERAIPYILMNRDVLACAQTGTGKTASFALPMIEILSHGRTRARMPRTLIVEPTRELAAQVVEQFEMFGKYHNLSVALLIGGVNFSDQEKVLDRGADVLIATPGRLLDHFERGKVMLNDVKMLVLDESDRMLDMGFIPDIERIIGLLPRNRQTLLFSATMPKEIRRLAEKFMHNPKDITVDPPATAAKTVRQQLVRVAARDKRKVLVDLITSENFQNALVFCNRKRDVASLHRALEKQKLSVGALHGDMDQYSRTETLERFKSGAVKVLVCSDVAARGLDIPAMSHVFNYDVPNHAEDYVHRIGRTGRAGREGIAITLATAEDDKALIQIRKLLKVDIPELTRQAATGDAPRDEANMPDTEVADGTARAGRPRDGDEPRRAARERSHGRKRTEQERRAPRRAERSGTPRHQDDAAQKRGETTPVGLGDHVPAFLLREPVIAAD